MADIKIPEAPDYAGGVDESYKAQQEELERQQKQAQREQRAAIFNDMAGLAFDALKLHGGLTVKERESEMGKARKRKEELMQRAGAMKAQYAKDRMAARHSQFNSDMQIAKMNQDIAAAEASAAASAAKAKQAQENWQKNYDENKRRADRSYNFQVRRHNDNVSVRREQARATAARGVRGKQLGFADGNGNQVSIYENVWKGSMQGIYDTLVANGIKPEKWEDEMSASDKEDFVKQNWYKSDKARAQMLVLSKLDHVTMTSELNDGVEDKGLGWGNSNNNGETDW